MFYSVFFRRVQQDIQTNFVHSTVTSMKHDSVPRVGFARLVMDPPEMRNLLIQKYRHWRLLPNVLHKHHRTET